MKIAKAFDRQGLFLTPLEIKRIENIGEGATGQDIAPPGGILGASPATPGPISPLLLPGSTIYVPYLSSAWQVSAQTEVVPEKPASKPAKIMDKLKDATAVAAFGAAPLGVIPIAGNTSSAHLAAHLTSYGFTPGSSEQIASHALNFARSNGGHLCMVFLAGFGAGVGTAEMLHPELEAKKKVWAGVILGAALVAFFALLIWLGIWGQSERPAAKATTGPGPAAESPKK